MKPQEQMNNQMNKRDFKKLFNMNNVLNQIMSYGAYLILTGSIIILIYMSFIESLDLNLDWKTIGIFSLTTVGLSWFCWDTFYRKQYEQVLSDDIEQQGKNKYSIHSRYYNAIKDWTDISLQKAIDSFNEDYTKKWLNWVEKTTGYPIETRFEEVTDPITKKIDVVKHLGIKDLPYKKFKYKFLMWRIKNHKYPQSGYTTSMELMSLFSFQESNMNKRQLRADKYFYRKGAIKKLVFSLLAVGLGASLVPTIITGNWEAILLKLLLALGALFSSVFTGAIGGVRGARLKLSIVEDTCFDLEKWGNKKPIISPYKEPIKIEEKTEQLSMSELLDISPTTTLKEGEITSDIFKT